MSVLLFEISHYLLAIFSQYYVHIFIYIIEGFIVENEGFVGDNHTGGS